MDMPFVLAPNLWSKISLNKVNIDFLKEQVSKLQEDVEKLIRNGNGAH